MKKLIINLKGLREQIKIAEGFEWTGWRIPVYSKEFDSFEEIDDAFSTKDEIEMHLCFGGWLSNNSWQPDALEIAMLEKWDSECEDHEGFKENCGGCDCQVDDIIDYIKDEIIEYFNEVRSASEYFNPSAIIDYEIVIE